MYWITSGYFWNNNACDAGMFSMGFFFLISKKRFITKLFFNNKVGLLSNSFREVYDLRRFSKKIIERYNRKKNQEELDKLENSQLESNVDQHLTQSDSKENNEKLNANKV